MEHRREHVTPVLEFIDMVETRPCLWNHTLKTYGRSDAMSDAWREIAEESGDTSHIIPGLLIACMGLVGCNAVAGVGLLTVSLGLNGAVVMTNLQNPQDLAPNFAATIFGIMSTIGGCTGFISAEVTSQFIKHDNNIKNWSYNFALGGAIYIFCGVFFIIFCSTNTQPWNERKEEQPAAAAAT